MVIHPRTHDPNSTPGTYHASNFKHVATPYDKKSQLYHPDLWNWHDLYEEQVSYKGSIVTRSQTAFNRVNIGDAEMKLFADKMRHHPPNLPHLIMTMKDGTYGAIPRTIITRSMAEQLEINPTLNKTIEAYKSFEPLKSLIRPEKERNPSIINRFFKKDGDPVDTNPNPRTDQNEKNGMNKFLSFSDLKETTPMNSGPVRYIDQPKHFANTIALGGKPPLLRESKFSQEVLGNLSQPKLSFSSAGLSKLLKEPSFPNNQNPYSIALVNSQRMESLSRREDQKNQVSYPSISFGVPRGFSIPTPGSRVFQPNKMNSYPQYHKQPPFMLK